MIEDRYGQWTLPKGKQERDETVEETALREIMEETNIRGEIIKELAKTNYDYDHPGRGQVHKVVHYFLVKYVAGIETPQLEEIARLEWLAVAQAKERQRSHGYKNNDHVLDEAIRFLSDDLKMCYTKR